MKKLFARLNLPTLWRALSLMKKQRRLFLLFIFGFCAIELLSMTLYAPGVKGFVNGVANQNAGALLPSLLLMLTSFLIWWVYAPISAFITGRISAQTLRRIKRDFAAQALRLPMGYHDKAAQGDTLSRLSNDAGCFEQIYMYGFCPLLSSALCGLWGVVLMALMDWRFALVVFGLGSLSVLLAAYFASKLEQAGTRQQEQLAETTVDAYALVKAAKTIRLLGLQQNRLHNFCDTAEKEAAVRTHAGTVTARMNSLIRLTNALAYVTILLLGALFVQQGLTDWGTVIALIGLKEATDRLFVECGQFLAGMQKSLAGVKRVLEVLDTPVEALQSPTAVNTACALNLEHICFGYTKNQPVLRDFSMQLQKNSFTVLCGPSGCGKSTVIKLLLGLYTPDSGTISAAYAGTLRELTAYVPQEANLFRGTILENLLLGNPGAAMQDVRQAAALAGADDFISTMPKGYETELLDCGASLSGGQRQRIAIARALLKDAPILLLDEITSALDAEAEAHILKTVKALTASKAVLFITHKQSISFMADYTNRIP